MKNYVLISATNTESPVDLTGFKRHLNFSVSDTSRDENFTELLAASTDAAQQHTGRQFMPAEYELKLSAFPANGEAEIDRLPVTGISSVKYFDGDNNEVTLTSGTDYYVDLASDPVRVVFVNQYTTYEYRADAIRIRFVSGYANAAAVPPAIKAAIKMAAANIYVNPGDRVDNLPTVSQKLLRPFKVH